MSEQMSELQRMHAVVIDSCNELAKAYASAIVVSGTLEAELAKVRGAFEMAAESRGLWKRRALDAGWHAESLAVMAIRADIEAQEAWIKRNLWNPVGSDDQRATLSEAVGQALGSASMAWQDVAAAGQFDDAWATRVYDGLMAYLSDWGDEVRKQANEATAAKLALASHEARRGNDVEAWIKRYRDSQLGPGEQKTGAWYVANQLLDDYRVHADTGVPLLSGEAMGPHTEDEPGQLNEAPPCECEPWCLPSRPCAAQRHHWEADEPFRPDPRYIA